MKNKGGRPTKLTPETIKKLEEAFAIDATVEEACFYADISSQTYYTFVKRNPKFLERFRALSQKPVLKARKTTVDSLDEPEHAHWYLERKRKREFGRTLDITTDDEPLEFDISHVIKERKD